MPLHAQDDDFYGPASQAVDSQQQPEVARAPTAPYRPQAVSGASAPHQQHLYTAPPRQSSSAAPPPASLRPGAPNRGRPPARASDQLRTQSVEESAVAGPGLGISVEPHSRQRPAQAVERPLPERPAQVPVQDGVGMELQRSRASSFFLGADDANQAMHDSPTSSSPHPDYHRSSSNESHEGQSEAAHGSSQMSHGRRSSFYGLDAYEGTQADAHNRPIPRSRSAAPQDRSFRQSLPEPGSWNRQRRDRSVSGLSSSGYAASTFSEGAPPMPKFNRDHLQSFAGQSLVPRLRALDMYRANCKKTNDPELVYEFATHILNVVQDLTDEELDQDTTAGVAGTAGGKEPPSSRRSSMLAKATPKIKHMASSPSTNSFMPTNGSGSASSSSSSVNRSPNAPQGARADSPGQQGQQQQDQLSFDTDLADTKRNALIIEAAQLLKKCADKGHLDSQILLANLHLRGTLNSQGKADWNRAFPLFVLAGKRGHTEAAFRSGQGYENGWGTRKDPGKAVQWYRKAASANHPAAMFRLGMAELKGELGMPVKAKEGFKWINRTAERVDKDQEPSEETLLALQELGRLHEHGVEHVVFVDNEYAAECYAKAAQLGHADSAFKLGEIYEYGRNGCPRDSALSIHYYNIAAQQHHPEACFGVAAFYLAGIEGVLSKSETEAYLWAKRAADGGLSKAQFACGYFCENGMGTYKDMREALEWYKQAAENGDQRAVARLQQAAAEGTPVPFTPKTNNGVSKRASKAELKRRTMAERNREDLASQEKKDKDCIIS